MITEEQKRIVLDNYAWVAEHSKRLIDSIATSQVLCTTGDGRHSEFLFLMFRFSPSTGPL